MLNPISGTSNACCFISMVLSRYRACQLSVPVIMSDTGSDYET